MNQQSATPSNSITRRSAIYPSFPQYSPSPCWKKKNPARQQKAIAQCLVYVAGPSIRILYREPRFATHYPARGSRYGVRTRAYLPSPSVIMSADCLPSARSLDRLIGLKRFFPGGTEVYAPSGQLAMRLRAVPVIVWQKAH